jgi:hypothetical protein
LCILKLVIRDSKDTCLLAANIITIYENIKVIILYIKKNCTQNCCKYDSIIKQKPNYYTK